MGEQQPGQDPFFTNGSLTSDRSAIRRLGRIESYQVALQSLDQMRGIILACRYLPPPRLVPVNMQPELIRTFERAVARVVLKHPAMHVGLVAEHTDRPCWIRLERLDLRNHIEWQTVKGCSDSFVKAFHTRANQLLDTRFTNYATVPGWKLVVLRQESANSIEVLLVFNHTNMDGGSAKIFHRDLLQSLHEDDPEAQTNDSLGLKSHILTLPPPHLAATLSPPPEKLVQFPVDRSLMLQYLKSEVDVSAVNYPRTPTQAHWARIAAAPFQTQFRSINIPNARLLKLVHSCHNRQTTLTGLLHAAILVSLAPLLPPAAAPAFSSLTAMDLRRFLPRRHASYPSFDREQAMSNYVTIVNHVFNEDTLHQIRATIGPRAANDPAPKQDPDSHALLTDLIWSAAKRVRRDIVAKLDQGTENDMIGFAQAVGDWRAQLREEAQRPRRTSWVVTNLGVLDNMPTAAASSSNSKSEPVDSWSLAHTEFIMSANVVSSAISISLAAVRGGDLVLTCSWQDCVIDVDLGEAFVANLESRLKSLARNSDDWAPRAQAAPPAPTGESAINPVWFVVGALVFTHIYVRLARLRLDMHAIPGA